MIFPKAHLDKADFREFDMPIFALINGNRWAGVIYVGKIELELHNTLGKDGLKISAEVDFWK